MSPLVRGVLYLLRKSLALEKEGKRNPLDNNPRGWGYKACLIARHALGTLTMWHALRPHCKQGMPHCQTYTGDPNDKACLDATLQTRPALPPNTHGTPTTRHTYALVPHGVFFVSRGTPLVTNNWAKKRYTRYSSTPILAGA